MRQTLVSCRRGKACFPSGFTLLELLLVLTLVALLTGLVAPRMWQWLQGARIRAGIDGVRAELEAVPQRAFSVAQRVAVTADGPLPLPDGWHLEMASPLVYEANGMTAGGRLRLIANGRVSADWRIEPPAGVVRDATAQDGPFVPAPTP